MFFSIPVFIKEEPSSDEFDDLNLLPIKKDNSNEDLAIEKQNKITGTNILKDKFVIKEEPVQEDLVSKC